MKLNAMKFIIVFLIVFFNFVKGQDTKFPDNFTFQAPKYQVKTYGNSDLNIYYQVKFSNNINVPGSKKETICILQLGSNYSKFIDYKGIQQDSISEKFSNQERIGGKEINQLLKVREIWSAVIFKNKLTDSLIIQDKAKDRYQYEEKTPIFKWTMSSGEKKKILGYECNKATTLYKGRDYTAWYTDQIPINNGPYVFGGLPGLILEIEDDKKNFLFQAVAMNQKPNNIYLRNDKSIFKVTRDKFRRIQQSYYDNPGFFHGKAYNMDGSQMSMKSNPLPYNPIELE
ncbi:GLPGLI family protein [Chryseobacterium sp. Tr-659]|uniref:GLPGLI family protein n=1 Tax=Chryseobacterium sp. Tr-659 TaxID=2608340 RepID=UPI0014224D25|nr:GLPGLI family protein [Chryseobacterium sp. Tr-659]NIF05073.1 GLPGLI family protein [Chryseobacterium sp. Tr-659]